MLVKYAIFLNIEHSCNLVQTNQKAKNIYSISHTYHFLIQHYFNFNNLFIYNEIYLILELSVHFCVKQGSVDISLTLVTQALQNDVRTVFFLNITYDIIL